MKTLMKWGLVYLAVCLIAFIGGRAFASTTFTADGQSTGIINARDGDTVDWEASTDNASSVIQVQVTGTPTTGNWKTLETVQAESQSGSILNEGSPKWYRVYCSDFKDGATMTGDVSIAARTIEQWKTKDGTAIFTIKDDGVTVDSGTITVTDGSIAAGDVAVANTKIIVGNASGVGAAVSMSGDGSLANDGAFTSTIATMIPVRFGGTWAVDADAVQTNGAGMVGDVTATTLDAAFCKVYDSANAETGNCAATSGLTGATADFQIFADAGPDGDYFAIGHSVPFCEAGINMSATVGVYGGAALTPQYWDGDSWETLTLVLDNTGTTATTGTTLGERDGAISFIPPADWASTTIDSQAAYWIRFIVSTTGNLTTTGILSDEPQIVTAADTYAAPHDMSITGVRLIDGASTLHTTADIKFILINQTTGEHSGELTFAQDKRQDSWTLASALTVSADDELAVLVTQEDGTAEAINVVLELLVTLT